MRSFVSHNSEPLRGLGGSPKVANFTVGDPLENFPPLQLRKTKTVLAQHAADICKCHNDEMSSSLIKNPRNIGYFITN
jgi:hypothetical protein